MIFWIIAAAACFILALTVGLDMFRFGRAKEFAENPKAAKSAAGGFLYVQGGKTYYKMPKGNVRKIADYAMDLRPGSVDMVRFTDILNQAAEEHAQEVREAKEKADAAMREVAKECAK